MEQSHKPAPQNARRLAYAKPCLLEYGSVAELTAATGSDNKHDSPLIPNQMGSI